jgi:hypothetical protein
MTWTLIPARSVLKRHGWRMKPLLIVFGSNKWEVWWSIEKATTKR